MSTKTEVGVDLALTGIIEANAIRVAAGVLSAGETTGLAVGVAAIGGTFAGAGLILALTLGGFWAFGDEHTNEEIETALQNVFPLLTLSGTMLAPMLAATNSKNLMKNVSLYGSLGELGLGLGLSRDFTEARQTIEQTLLGSRDIFQAASRPTTNQINQFSNPPGRGGGRDGRNGGESRTFVSIPTNGKDVKDENTQQQDVRSEDLQDPYLEKLFKELDPNYDGRSPEQGVEKIDSENGPSLQLNMRTNAPGNGNLNRELGSEQEHGLREFNFNGQGERVAGPDRVGEGETRDA